MHVWMIPWLSSGAESIDTRPEAELIDRLIGAALDGRAVTDRVNRPSDVENQGNSYYYSAG